MKTRKVRIIMSVTILRLRGNLRLPTMCFVRHSSDAGRFFLLCIGLERNNVPKSWEYSQNNTKPDFEWGQSINYRMRRDVMYCFGTRLNNPGFLSLITNQANVIWLRQHYQGTRSTGFWLSVTDTIRNVPNCGYNFGSYTYTKTMECYTRIVCRLGISGLIRSSNL